MALVGTIKDFGLADILQLIGLQRKTGVLTLERPADTVTVKFLDGAVVGAETSLRNLEDLLGSVLVRTGRITQAQLKEALQIQQGSLYPAVHRLEKRKLLQAEWKVSETGREAKFYSLTKAGRKQLEVERTNWEQLTQAMSLILRTAE